MSVSQVRRIMYLFARLAGDLQAVRRGRIGPRMFNRITGRIAGRAMGKVWR